MAGQDITKQNTAKQNSTFQIFTNAYAEYFKTRKLRIAQNSINTDKGLNKFFKQITGQHTLS